MLKTSPVASVQSAHHVGDDVRALRKARSMTLSDLATELNRSVGWLSQVERGQTNPSISDIRLIGKIFEIPVSFFFRNDLAEDDERGIVVRSETRASLGSRQDGLVEELLSPDLSGEFELIHSTFEPGFSSEFVLARPTLEAGYLISGCLTLEFRDKKFIINAGDSFQFQNQDYRWSNEGEDPAVAVWVISPPVY